MNTIKSFTNEQRVQDNEGKAGTVVKIGRKYIHVQLDGTTKPTQYLPEQLSEIPAPVVPPVLVVEDEAHGLFASKTNVFEGNAVTSTRPGKVRPGAGRPDKNTRKAARKSQKAARRKTRATR